MVTFLPRAASIALATAVVACGGNTSLDESVGVEGGAGGTGGECVAAGGTGASPPAPLPAADSGMGLSACTTLLLESFADWHDDDAPSFGFDACDFEPGQFVVESVQPDRLTLVGLPVPFRLGQLAPYFAPGDVVTAGNRAHGSIPDGWDYIIGARYRAFVGGSVPSDIPDGPHLEPEALCSNLGCTPCGEPRQPENIYGIWVSGFEGQQWLNRGGGVSTNNWFVFNLDVAQYQSYCTPECSGGVDRVARIAAIGPLEQL